MTHVRSCIRLVVIGPSDQQIGKGDNVFMNLHTLPSGTHMYTAYVGDVEEYDEVDFTGPATAKSCDLLHLAYVEADDLYDLEHKRVVAIADQSDGEMVWTEDKTADDDRLWLIERVRCTDCGGLTFCGVAHGAGHDHSDKAKLCTRKILGGRKL